MKVTKETEVKGKILESKEEGKHSWNGCGSEARKDERKHTAMPSTEPERNAWETRQDRTGKP